MSVGLFYLALVIAIEIGKYAVPIVAVCAVAWTLAAAFELRDRFAKPVAQPARMSASTPVVRTAYRPHRPHMRHRWV